MLGQTLMWRRNGGKHCICCRSGGVVLTYEDEANGKQYLLMLDEVRDALGKVGASYIAMAKEGRKGPSAKELRMASMMANLLGHTDFSIVDGMVINHRATRGK